MCTYQLYDATTCISNMTQNLHQLFTETGHRTAVPKIHRPNDTASVKTNGIIITVENINLYYFQFTPFEGINFPNSKQQLSFNSHSWIFMLGYHRICMMSEFNVWMDRPSEPMGMVMWLVRWWSRDIREVQSKYEPC